MIRRTDYGRQCVTDQRFTAIPEQDWEAADEAITRHAFTVVDDALEDPAAVKYLHWYYDPGGNYAGSTFLDLDPVSPWNITSADLLALTLLSVQAPPYSVRRLLEPSPDRSQVLRLLAEDRLPLDADLAMADADTLLPWPTSTKRSSPVSRQPTSGRRIRGSQPRSCAPASGPTCSPSETAWSVVFSVSGTTIKSTGRCSVASSRTTVSVLDSTRGSMPPLRAGPTSVTQTAGFAISTLCSGCVRHA